ncbi:hypothetical protein BZL30_0585 [Mycobacterium kansasii]|uniref:Uncharacterized protein n=1 Tax=Mycobacterium kansasii TaxID=1768 RepID=A0A1V3XSP1_MYCKA|nr:hypothetical protein BZL30_0585 [Mycobacterium kansasii]
MAGTPKRSSQGSTPGGTMADPATVFSALAEIIYQGANPSEIYAAICVAATLIVPGCDHASMLVKTNDRYVTVGASDRLAQRIDEIERRAGDGPCIDAIEEETPQIETDLTTPSQWPKFAAALVADTPVRGAMGFRLQIDKRKAAALNLFADAPTASTPNPPGERQCWPRSPVWPSTPSPTAKTPPACAEGCSATGKSARRLAC